ncbi:MAG TPA: PAS domain S-box protein, partial [Labilithrix sp.]|nr:PAS domain S-box protein [Labilithrix sp.]
HELRAKVAVLVELFRQKKALERQAQDLSATRRLLRDQEEQAYGEREALFRRSFDQAPVGIGHLTPDGRWIEANVRLCEILDHSRAQLIGRSAADMVGGAADWKIKEAIARLAAGEARGQARERRVVPLKSGESSAVLWISAIREASNRVMMLVVVIDDASARVTGEPEREHPSQTPAPVRLASGGSDETSSLESLALQEVVP